MRARRSLVAIIFLSLALVLPGRSAVLPDERADALYHAYKGGGVEIDGPSLLVRKQIGSSFSATANYYVDSITSASPDVITQGSPYAEERNEFSGSIDYLHGDTTMTAGYTNSEENDYSANTAFFGISVDMFGDLTTVSLGYGRGWDEVRRNGDPSFAEDVSRQSYRVGLSQVVTKNSLLSLAYEVVTDEGFLNNPYRSVRFIDPNSPKGFSFEPELYPRTRTSNALALRGAYYLPYRAAVRGEFRFFTDSWGIQAQNAEVGYVHPFGKRWTLDLRYRYYQQDAADFYSDLFNRSEEFNFRARDKELSQFNSHTLGAGIAYEFLQDGWQFLDRGSINLKYDRIMFRYDNYRDITQGGAVGEEPLYRFDADVVQLFLSIWY